MSADLRCLICSQICGTHLYYMSETFSCRSNVLKSALKKLFHYLLLPKRNFERVWSIFDSMIPFCVNCFEIVQEIIKIQEKALALNLMIKHKVRTLGDVVAATPPHQFINSRGKSKKTLQMWHKFRDPVIQNYMKGLLPNPSVRIEPHSTRIYKSKVQKSDSTKADLEDEDSDLDNLYEEIKVKKVKLTKTKVLIVPNESGIDVQSKCQSELSESCKINKIYQLSNQELVSEVVAPHQLSEQCLDQDAGESSALKRKLTFDSDQTSLFLKNKSRNLEISQDTFEQNGSGASEELDESPFERVKGAYLNPEEVKIIKTEPLEEIYKVFENEETEFQGLGIEINPIFQYQNEQNEMEQPKIDIVKMERILKLNQGSTDCYKCPECDFVVKPSGQEKSSLPYQIDAQNKIVQHYIQQHNPTLDEDKLTKIMMANFQKLERKIAKKRKTAIVKCPKCDFTAVKTGSESDTISNLETIARKDLYYHYTEHISTSLIVSETLSKLRSTAKSSKCTICKCDMCDFIGKVDYNDPVSPNSANYLAKLKLAEHYVLVHEHTEKEDSNKKVRRSSRFYSKT